MSQQRIGTQCLHAGYTPGNGEPRNIPIVQSILKGMQDCLDDLSTESLRDEGKLKQTLQAELDRLGAAAATGQIAYTGGAVEGCWSEAAYDGSGTLVTHDLVVEGMA